MLVIRRVKPWALVGLLFTCSLAKAEVNARALLGALAGRHVPASGAAVSVVVERNAAATEEPVGLIPISHHFFGLRGSAREIADFAGQHPGLGFEWSPPRHLLLDRVATWTHAADYRANGGGSGKGVVVGIVDTGVDLTHPDLRNADGTTRVAWLLDFSRAPAGLHSEIETRLGCEDKPGLECQVLSAADIDARLASGALADLPSDEIGHGTHVASLAAGNGLSNDPARYLGSAPEATLIVVRVTRTTASIDDLDILLATNFVFEQAEALGMPAVVNLSLGSDFGPHDGTSSLSRGLADQLDRPGRAIVVAAGNSGTLTSGIPSYPEPLGIHTEVFVPRGDGVRIPILTPPPVSNAHVTNGSVFVWIGFQPGSDLRLGLDRTDGPWVEPIGKDATRVVQDGDLTVTLLNNAVVQGGPLTKDTDGAVAIFDGSWDAGRTFVLRMAGEGTANFWLQSTGDLDPALGTSGAVFPRATAEQTVNIPAAHPDLIAVGASINRTEWSTRSGGRVDVGRAFGDNSSLLEPDSAAWFSSAGPMSTGSMKPDLVAPGGFVVGAMSKDADPLRSLVSIFSDTSFCGHVRDCNVVDDFHAVSTGTSMAAPIVSGAVALLFERDPSLTHEQIKGLLQSGARQLTGGAAGMTPVSRVGAGMLDIVEAVSALNLLHSGQERLPTASQSEILLGSSFLQPGPEARLQGIVKLRDATGNVAGNFASSRVRLHVSNATLAQDLSSDAPGIFSFQLGGVSGSGGRRAEVQLLFDDQAIVTTTLPIAVDSSVANEGYRVRGGCNVGGAIGVSERRSAFGSFGVLGLLLWQVARRARREPKPRSETDSDG